MPSIKRVLPFGLKRWVKEAVAGMVNIPVTKFDVPLALINALPKNKPIAMIDVGASTGEFTHSIDRWCGIRKGLLIEPQPDRIESMKAQFPADRFSCAWAAVSSGESSIEMDILNWDYSSSILPVRRDMPSVTGMIDLGVRERIRVQASTLDNLCRAHGFGEPVDLLKIDVQGAESLVLAGATETLRRTRLLWMELSLQPLYEGAETIESMIRLCRERNFILRNLEDGFRGADGELLQVDALFSAV